MNIHENARTTPHSRAVLVRRVREEGWHVAQAAEAAGISERTAYKWLRRYDQAGELGLRDRSCRAHHHPHALSREWCELLVFMRGFRLPAQFIAGQLGMPISTVSAVFARHGLGPVAALEPPKLPNRYERRQAGELLHLDIKKLARFYRPGHRVTGSRTRQSDGAGWEYVHVAIDDYSRLAYVEILPNERGGTCAAFARRACDWFARQGITIKALLTDNGTGYRSHRFRAACQRLHLRHHRTRPYTPRTNGKAERFIKTLLREWAYFRLYRNSTSRANQLPRWLRFYNQERPHASLGYLPPTSRRPRYEQRS
ncbi:MAG: IS481 family transposase [Betaproteobacteria bacterium]|nr:IS481 family transposase [Betaproteobacteria bacterium]